MEKVSRVRAVVTILVAICAYLFFQYVLLVCTPVAPTVCKPQFSFFFNLFFGIVIGVLAYLAYGIFGKK